MRRRRTALLFRQAVTPNGAACRRWVVARHARRPLQPREDGVGHEHALLSNEEEEEPRVAACGVSAESDESIQFFFFFHGCRRIDSARSACSCAEGIGGFQKLAHLEKLENFGEPGLDG